MIPRTSSRNPSRVLVSRVRWTAVFAAVVLLAAPGPAHAGILGYFRDRGEDFLDILRLRWIVPYRAEGYGLKARVTTLAQVGYVHLDGDAYGMDRRAIGHNTERRTEGGLSIFYASNTHMEKKSGNQYLDPTTKWSQAARRGIVRRGGAWDDGRLHPLSIGAEVELGVFGIDVGVYPEEMIDFTFGWFFLDIFKDDRSFTDKLPDYGPAPQLEELAPITEPTFTSPTLPLQPQEPGLLPEEKPEVPPEIPEGLKAPEPQSEAPRTTLESEFVTPKDVEELRKSGEAAPKDIETIQTPLNPENKPGESTPPPVPPAPDLPAPPPVPDQPTPTPG